MQWRVAAAACCVVAVIAVSAQHRSGRVSRQLLPQIICSQKLLNKIVKMENFIEVFGAEDLMRFGDWVKNNE